MSAASSLALRPDVPRAAASSPPWMGGFRDLAREHGFEPMRVEGHLPAELAGTLYRNGPARFAAGGERVGHWFDGDGGVTAVRIARGEARGAARLVRTSGLAREEQAGKRLFGGYDTPFARPFRELFLRDGKNTANTSVLLWNDRLFATCEAGKPHEIDRADLSTIGETDLGGVVVGAFSAHGHYVRARRATYDFGLTMGMSTKVDAYVLPDGGVARRIATFPLRGARMNHDFVATDRHLVFVFAPMFLSVTKILLARRGPVSSARWRPELGAEIVVVPIDEPARVLRFRADPFMMEHVVNAWEEGDEVVFDYTHYESPRALEGFVGRIADGRIEEPLASSVRRARVDIRRGTLRTETVLARAVELPRVSPRIEGERHRFAYHGGFASPSSARAPFDAVLKHDLETGKVDAYVPGNGQHPGEAVFAPRPGARAEDDGWLLTVVYDARADRSRLDVLDARGPADGPLASCLFDQAIPFGFHGAWAADR